LPKQCARKILILFYFALGAIMRTQTQTQNEQTQINDLNLSRENFFLVNRAWDDKIEIFLDSQLNLLNQKQFLSLPDGLVFSHAGHACKIHGNSIVYI